MATRWEISDAKERFDELLTRVRSGEEIILTEGGRPVMRVLATEQNNSPRVFGEFAGKIHMSDDFAAQLTPPEQAEWEK